MSMDDPSRPDAGQSRELAWKQLIAMHTAHLAAYVRSFEHNTADRADLLQGTWVKVFETTVETGIADVGWPAVLDCCRAAARITERSRRRDPLSAANRSRTENSYSTVGAVAESEESDDLDIRGDFAWDSVARLPSRQREVLVYRLLFEKTEAETAAILCIAIGTVKVHFHRALKALRAGAQIEPQVAKK